MPLLTCGLTLTAETELLIRRGKYTEVVCARENSSVWFYSSIPVFVALNWFLLYLFAWWCGNTNIKSPVCIDMLKCMIWTLYICIYIWEKETCCPQQLSVANIRIHQLTPHPHLGLTAFLVGNGRCLSRNWGCSLEKPSEETDDCLQQRSKTNWWAGLRWRAARDLNQVVRDCTEWSTSIIDCASKHEKGTPGKEIRRKCRWWENLMKEWGNLNQVVTLSGSERRLWRWNMLGIFRQEIIADS